MLGLVWNFENTGESSRERLPATDSSLRDIGDLSVCARGSRVPLEASQSTLDRQHFQGE